MAFPLRLMFKDFGLILQKAMELSVPMPATAAAAQVCAAEHAWQFASHSDEDFSAVIRTMQQMAEGRGAGLKGSPKAESAKSGMRGS